MKTYELPAGKDPMVDQEWAADVNHVIKNELGWDGESLNLPPAQASASPVIIVGSAAGNGIKVDLAHPTYCWVDLLGEIRIDQESSSNKPAFSTYIGNIKQYQFAVSDRVYNTFHMTHDYAPGTDMYIHAHWGCSVATAGSVTWEFEVTYAKGHQQQTFITPVTLTVQQAFVSPHMHMIAEIPLSGSAAGLIPTSMLEPDGVMFVRTRLASKTINVDPFLHYVDLHYQSTNVGTKNKAPSFYA